MNKAFKHTAYVTLGLGFLLVGTLFFWGAYPYRTLEIETQPLPLLSESAHAGKEIELLVQKCNYSSAPRRMIVRLIGDGKETVLSNTWEETSPTGCSSSKQAVFIPKSTVPGVYTIQVTVTYKLNPIRTADPVVVSSLPFVVIE